MRTEYLTDTEGRKVAFLVPENERERRELARRTDLGTGGIGEPRKDGDVEPVKWSETE